MESALYGIYALVVFASEILLVRCAHSFDFWYVNNSSVNTVRQHFPWSILYMSVRGTHITREHISLSCLSETRQRRQSWKFLPLNYIFMTFVDICRHFENMILFKNHWPQTVAWGPERGYSIWEEGIGLTFDVVKSSPKRQRTEMFFEDVLQGFIYKQYYRALKFQ